MSVTRETKSWTWVNERPCPDCGFDASSTDPSDVAGILRGNLADWQRLLTGDTARLLVRPEPSTWSPVEYACHVSDVLDLLAHRFERTLAEDHPIFEDWHPDDRAASGRYDQERSPAAVLETMARRSQRATDLASSMTEGGWRRRGTRADGLEFTNGWIATYLAHDVVHHVHDVERILFGA